MAAKRVRGGLGQRLSPRVAALKSIFEAADIQTEAVTDIQTRVWEKFIYLAPMAAFTASARLPIGPIWGDEFIREMFLSAVDEVEAVARASKIRIDPGVRNRITAYTAGVPKTMRSSLLMSAAIIDVPMTYHGNRLSPRK